MADTQNGSAFGWLGQEEARDAFQQNDEMQQAAARFMLEQGKLVFDVLGMGRGPELLELLREQTIEKPLMVVHGTIGSAPEIGLGPAEWAYYREGQNSVIRYLETMIAYVERSQNEENNHV